MNTSVQFHALLVLLIGTVHYLKNRYRKTQLFNASMLLCNWSSSRSVPGNGFVDRDLFEKDYEPQSVEISTNLYPNILDCRPNHVQI
jgi:hypothetical protein